MFRYPFKISPKWDCILPLHQLVADSKFIFRNRNGIYIVTETECPYGINCFGIGYDKHGVLIKSNSIFSETWGNTIIDSSRDCLFFIEKWLVTEGAEDLLLIRQN